MLLRSSEGQYWEEQVITLKFLEIHKVTLRFSLRGDLGWKNCAITFKYM